VTAEPRRVRLAVVGAGDVAQRDYLPEAHRIADVAEIVMVCGRGEERAREVAGRFGIARWAAGYHQAVDSRDVDAVVNLTPPQAHAEVTLAALRAGKHVYTEKPLAPAAADAVVLRDEAARRGLMLVCAPSVMVFPQLAAARGMVSSGRLGPIHAARAVAFGGVPPWAGYISDPSPYFRREVGPLVDVGVYPLHALTGLLGPVRKVTAMSSRTRDTFAVTDGPLRGTAVPVEVDDNWQLILECGTGTVSGAGAEPGAHPIASVQANFCAVTAAGPECELFGEHGTLAFDLLDVAAPLRLSAGERWTEQQVAHGRDRGPDHILGVRHLAECVLSGGRPLLGPDRAIHVLEVIEAARASAREGRAVEVSAGSGPATRQSTSVTEMTRD
jgi:predicted dehydrogenase